MTVPGPCTQQDAHVSAYPMCICSAGRIGTTLCLEHTCMPHEALRLTVKPSHNVTSWPANWSSTSRLYALGQMTEPRRRNELCSCQGSEETGQPEGSPDVSDG